MPAYSPPASGLAFPNGKRKTRPMKSRILLLDDEETICDLLTDYFRHKNIELIATRTGRQAMERADTERFDIAIFDINVAGENGLELLGFFKANFPQLPIIILTGLAAEEDLRDQARLRGANGFMNKTDPLDDLFAAVKAYLPAQSKV
jgi:two-component system OmpR family response regulator